ncbi:MAG: PhoU family transcriptional regulator [Deltaproteobacteria bacterium HGW-Deltaproteobacteria-8]|jgi:phosphate uptake regulator|nr:MAG: PhoU family transcriptional regulator [Deltaproteobacteria bacterium HGW-Deltaproteobacteria-8]
MIALEGLEENFRFLVLEVTSQVSETRDFLYSPSHEGYDKVVSRDDYIDNLKNIVEEKCFSKIHSERGLSKRDIDRIRGLQIISGNLERIADYCVNIAGQLRYLHDKNLLTRHDPGPLFDIIQESLSRILEVRSRAEVAGALGICRAEFELDRLYKDAFDQLMNELRRGREVENCITAIFIFRYLERIGDSLLNIGEALLFSVIGEKIKIEQFQALQQNLSQSGFEGDVSDIDFRSIWGTRSGCRIGRVTQRDAAPDPAQSGIFKEGNLKKMRRERENIEFWAQISPGTGPRIFSYNEDGDSASMLVEFLPGCTWNEVVLTAEWDMLEDAIFVFEQTVGDIWRATLERGPLAVGVMSQLDGRLSAVRHVHPDFFRKPRRLGQVVMPSTEDLFQVCREIEPALFAPMTVLLHGDFNANNIVYDHSAPRVHYVDLHRSHRGDWVEDVSVFLVSFFRMPIFDSGLRGRINHMIASFFAHAHVFADDIGDSTWQARLALGLTRSLFTSTRFELNYDFAREMSLRAHYLMEGLGEHRVLHDQKGKSWEDYRLPRPVLFT